MTFFIEASDPKAVQPDKIIRCAFSFDGPLEQAEAVIHGSEAFGPDYKVIEVPHGSLCAEQRAEEPKLPAEEVEPQVYVEGAISV